MSHSVRPHRQQPTRLLCPWDSPGKEPWSGLPFPSPMRESESEVAQSCPTLCDPVNCSTPGFPVSHHFPEFAHVHVHWISDAIRPSHPLSNSSPPALSLSQHQGLCQWVGSSHQVAKLLELQHQSFQCILRVDFFLLGLTGLISYPTNSQESSPTPRFKSINLKV